MKIWLLKMEIDHLNRSDVKLFIAFWSGRLLKVAGDADLPVSNLLKRSVFGVWTAVSLPSSSMIFWEWLEISLLRPPWVASILWVMTSSWLASFVSLSFNLPSTEYDSRTFLLLFPFVNCLIFFSRSLLIVFKCIFSFIFFSRFKCKD